MNSLLTVQLVALYPIAAAIYVRENVRVRRSFVLTALAIESFFAVMSPITCVPYAVLAVGAVGSFFNDPLSNAPVSRVETSVFRALATLGILINVIIWGVILSFGLGFFL